MAATGCDSGHCSEPPSPHPGEGTTLTRAWLSHEITERKERKRWARSDAQALEGAHVGGIVLYQEHAESET